MKLIDTNEQPECSQVEFGLIVTGEGEEVFLPLLFRSLRDCGPYRFRVIRRIEQRSPISALERKLRMVGRGQLIPSKDETDIGLPARDWISRDPCNLVILVDDLEYDRQDHAQAVYDRYRLALDTMLCSDRIRRKASVHFLVMMLEAFFFADAAVLNRVLGLEPALEDYVGDVEAIRHPKNDLKHIKPGYDEVEDGEKIIAQLDVEHVLSRPDTCAALRTLFVWCVEAILGCCRGPYGEIPSYHIDDGVQYPVTNAQLRILGR